VTAVPLISFDDPLTAVAGYGIPGSVTSLPLEPLPGGEWEQLLADVRRHRLLSLLAAAVSHEAVPVTADQAGAVEALMTVARAATRQCVDVLVTTVDTLATAGVETRVVGGAAVAHLDYRDAALRPVDDVELLVKPQQRQRAITLLTARGYAPRVARVPTGAAHTQPARLNAPTGAHVTIVDQVGWLAAAPGLAWERTETFELDGRPLQALAREERLVDTCCRTAGQLKTAQATLHADVAPDRLVSLADRCGATSTVTDVVRSTWSELRLADVVALSTWSQSWHGRRNGGAPSAGIPGAFGRLARALSLRSGARR
jgi:hypothetical protein